MKVGEQTLQKKKDIWTGKACVKFLLPKTFDSRQKQRNIHPGEHRTGRDKTVKEEMQGARYNLNWRLSQKLPNKSFNESLGALL
jgi:hypothetical protein